MWWSLQDKAIIQEVTGLQPPIIVEVAIETVRELLLQTEVIPQQIIDLVQIEVLMQEPQQLLGVVTEVQVPPIELQQTTEVAVEIQIISDQPQAVIEGIAGQVVLQEIQWTDHMLNRFQNHLEWVEDEEDKPFLKW